MCAKTLHLRDIKMIGIIIISLKTFLIMFSDIKVRVRWFNIYSIGLPKDGIYILVGT